MEQHLLVVLQRLEDAHVLKPFNLRKIFPLLIISFTSGKEPLSMVQIWSIVAQFQAMAFSTELYSSCIKLLIQETNLSLVISILYFQKEKLLDFHLASFLFAGGRLLTSFVFSCSSCYLLKQGNHFQADDGRRERVLHFFSNQPN